MDQRVVTDQRSFSLLDAWRLSITHRVTIGIFTATMLLLSVVVAWILPPTYRAEVALTEVTAEEGLGRGKGGSPFSDLAGLAGVNLGRQGQSAERAAILHSRALVAEFINRKSLIPILMPKNNSRRTSWFAVRRFRDHVMHLKEDLQAGVITLTIDWTNPATAAEWANDFVALANDVIRRRDAENAERNIAFLNRQVQKTNDVELHSAIYNLIEEETRTLMLANSRPDYAFALVDPAVPPGAPLISRLLIVLLGGMFGLLVGFLFVVVRSIVLADARRGPQ
jgi:uncharacterized protein involved in exopolysaccharide biosynthesis